MTRRSYGMILLSGVLLTLTIISAVDERILAAKLRLYIGS